MNSFRSFRTLRTLPRPPPIPFRPTPTSLPFSSSAIASTSSPSSPSPPLSDAEQALKHKVESSLQGAKVEVQDVSGGCGSFFAISIAHSSFKGLTTVKQHRLVNELLKDEIKGMHGLQLKTTAE